ncbi:hypothetical protein OG786_01380 [Streptomyces sp. NBC_00101]
MSGNTPGQAEGERDDETADGGVQDDPTSATPSQAEGERDDEEGEE